MSSGRHTCGVTVPLPLWVVDLNLAMCQGRTHLTIIEWDHSWPLFLSPVSNCRPILALKGNSPEKRHFLSPSPLTLSLMFSSSALPTHFPCLWFSYWQLTFFFFFCLFRASPEACGVSRLGVELELQLPDYATETVLPDLSHVCDLNCSSQKCWML